MHGPPQSQQFSIRSYLCFIKSRSETCLNCINCVFSFQLNFTGREKKKKKYSDKYSLLQLKCMKTQNLEKQFGIYLVPSCKQDKEEPGS